MADPTLNEALRSARAHAIQLRESLIRLRPLLPDWATGDRALILQAEAEAESTKAGLDRITEHADKFYA